MVWPEPVTLRGEHASLEPLSSSHHDGLVEAATDGGLWKLWFTSIPKPDAMASWMDQLTAQQDVLPFAVLDRDGRPVGITTYLNIDAKNHRLEIGHTWYARRVQRTGLNTECKLMLLRHAFESLNCIAVEFRTSAMNHRSRAAIERLGAKLDGVLRSHKRHDNGTLRDTHVYSIIAVEWPTVKANLEAKLASMPSV
ncbi:MAG: GNAT family protein [Planctomycetota bacterium]